MREAILILAGGEARRFPGKLEYPLDGQPMILGILRRLREARRPVFIAGKGSFPAQIDALIDAPLLVDRGPCRGPLSALLWAATAIRADRIFAVAADQPRLDAAVLERLSAARRPGDEAVVPEHDGRMEPLAALYDRVALLERGPRLRREGRMAMHDLLASLATRRVAIDGGFFHNVNRVADVAGETSAQ